MIQEEKLKIVNDMVKAWNEVFNYSVRPIFVTISNQNVDELFAIFVSEFSGNIVNWIRYANAVNSSKYLMGYTKKDKRQAKFSWLIKPENIDNVLRGRIIIGDRALDSTKNSIYRNMKKLLRIMQERFSKNILMFFEMNLNNPEYAEGFNDYMLGDHYKDDGDKYKIESIIKCSGSGSAVCDKEGMIFFYNDHSGVVISLCLENYILKNAFGFVRYELMQKFSNLIARVRYNADGIKILRELRGELNYNEFGKDTMQRLEERISSVFNLGTSIKCRII